MLHLIHGDGLEVLRQLADGCADAVISDPPYPEIERDYGRISEIAWHGLMQGVVTEARRVLKPTGSMVFVLQPNAEQPGRMRSWFYDFLAWGAREVGIVQDVWWWNYGAMPMGASRRSRGLLRGSLKACVWLGPPNCYRDQDAVLWEPSDSVKALSREKRAFPTYSDPDGREIDKQKIMAASVERGGVTPFNVIPLANTDSRSSGGSLGHPAATPNKLAAWWVRYITKPGELVIDPFGGSGTVALEAHKLGRSAVSVEIWDEYHEIARKRFADLGIVA